MKELLDKVTEVQGDDQATHSRASLQEQLAMIAKVEVGVEKIKELHDKVIAIDPAQQQLQLDLQRQVSVSTNYRIMKLKGQANELLADLDASADSASSTPADVGAPVQGRRAHVQSYFEKRPFPKFTGEKRNYPSFRKEWKECVGLNYAEEFQVREIRRAIPKWIEPEVKNLKAMVDIWKYLDTEFGQEMEICSELIEALTNFKFSVAARSESEKFAELHAKWNEVYADLEEIGKTEVLNHEPTLMKICQKLPDQNMWTSEKQGGF